MHNNPSPVRARRRSQNQCIQRPVIHWPKMHIARPNQRRWLLHGHRKHGRGLHAGSQGKCLYVRHGNTVGVGFVLELLVLS